MNKSAGIDWPTVAKMLGGGAMLGGGLGAGVTFLKHLNELREGAKPPTAPNNDSDVLYVDIPERQPAPVRRKFASANNQNTASTFALSSLAGLVGTALAYNTVRDVYNRRRQRELETQLGNAQHIYLGNLGQMKSASQYSMPTKMIGTGYLALLLTALGSGVVAKKMLDKRFPVVENPVANRPRKVVIRSVDPTTHQPLESGTELPGSTSPTAMEGLVRTQMAEPKMAAHNELADVIAAAAAGRTDEIKSLIKTAGVDGMLAAVKGASLTAHDPVRNNFAITWVCHDPLVANAIAPIAAAEFFKCASWTYDVLPRLAQMGLDEAHLIGLVESSTEAVRSAALKPVFSKLASAKVAEFGGEHEGLSPMKTLFFAGALKTILDHPNREQASDHQDQTSVNGEEEHNQHTHGIPVEVTDDHANRFVRSIMPDMDRAINSPPSNAARV